MSKQCLEKVVLCFSIIALNFCCFQVLSAQELADHLADEDLSVQEKHRLLLETLEIRESKLGVGELAITKQGVRVTNGCVEINTAGIDRLVKADKIALPFIVELMKDSAVEFDRFVRLYSAADQILRNNGMEGHVYWAGGCRIIESEDGSTVRFASDGVCFNKEFREKVISSIEKSKKGSPNGDIHFLASHQLVVPSWCLRPYCSR